MCCRGDVISLEVCSCIVCGHKFTSAIGLEELKRALVTIQTLIEKVEARINENRQLSTTREK